MFFTAWRDPTSISSGQKMRRIHFVLGVSVMLTALVARNSLGQEVFADAPKLSDKLTTLISQSHPWFTSLEPAWRQSLLGCIYTKGNADILVESNAELATESPSPSERLEREFDRIEAQDTAFFDEHCPETMAEVRKLVP
jgi:hypothetical protein